jgi:hypothetical protein
MEAPPLERKLVAILPRDDGVDNRVWVYAIRAEAFEDKSPSDRLGLDTPQIRGRRGAETAS